MPLITDSGGFQVFSLAYGSVADELKSRGTKKRESSVLKISEEGVLFRSYIDGSKILLTPETSIAAQKDFGADIMITFDELPPYHIGERQLKESFDRTHRWQKRSLQAHKNDPRKQALYAVIHGGVDWELRRQRCSILREDDYEGFAIGGSLGKTKEEMYQLLVHTTPHLPKEKPNHLLGIGDLTSVIAAIPFGIDTFDSSYPTKMARHGVLLTHDGPLNVTKGEHKKNFTPISPSCSCYACKNFTVAYLNHLFKAKELLAYTLATIHNLTFMVEKMKSLREDIFMDKI